MPETRFSLCRVSFYFCSDVHHVRALDPKGRGRRARTVSLAGSASAPPPHLGGRRSARGSLSPPTLQVPPGAPLLLPEPRPGDPALRRHDGGEGEAGSSPCGPRTPGCLPAHRAAPTALPPSPPTREGSREGEPPTHPCARAPPRPPSLAGQHPFFRGNIAKAPGRGVVLMVAFLIIRHHWPPRERAVLSPLHCDRSAACGHVPRAKPSLAPRASRFR